MKNKKKISVLVLSSILLVVILLTLIYRFLPSTTQTPQETCLQNNETWLGEHNECEGMTQKTCEDLGGTYEECGSPCRHNPEAEYCAQVCVSYCAFD